MLGQTILWDEVNRHKLSVRPIWRGPRRTVTYVGTEGVCDKCTNTKASGPTCGHDYRFLEQSGFSPLVSFVRAPASHL